MTCKCKSIPLKMDSDYLRNFSFTDKLSYVCFNKQFKLKRNTIWKIFSVFLFFLFMIFISHVVLQEVWHFMLLYRTSSFKVPFLAAPYHYKMVSKSLSLILSNIDTCNAKWKYLCVLNKKLSTTGVKFSWILHKRFIAIIGKL